MGKTDLKRELKDLYFPPDDRPVMVEVPPLQYLMIEGEGDPNTSKDYMDAIAALYSVGYTMKFALKKQDGFDFTMMPLESLWWADDPEAFLADHKGEWKWTAMILQPDLVKTEHVEAAISEATRKKELPAASKIKLQLLFEGTSAQMMHVGPYSEETPTIEKLHAFIHEHGYALRGKHHEIYLGDPRKSAPEKLKTVIRQPIG